MALQANQQEQRFIILLRNTDINLQYPLSMLKPRFWRGDQGGDGFRCRRQTAVNHVTYVDIDVTRLKPLARS